MQEYKRLVAIDVGTKRIGVAQTDLLQTIASPVGTFSPAEIMDQLKLIARQAPIEQFIVGWPLMPDGNEGRATEMVAAFIKRLNNVFPEIPVQKIDERNTSQKAFNAMLQAGIPKKKRREKERVDRIAAALILQSYLDSLY